MNTEHLPWYNQNLPKDKKFWTQAQRWEEYKARRAAYNFSCLPYETWESWDDEWLKTRKPW